MRSAISSGKVKELSLLAGAESWVLITVSSPQPRRSHPWRGAGERPMSILRLLGNNRKLCDGISRRDLIQAGALSLFGLTIGDLFRLEEAMAAAGTGAAN